MQRSHKRYPRRTKRSDASSSLPKKLFLPPDHPICDILRLGGALPASPSEIDRTLEKLNLTVDDETTLAVRRSMGLQYTPLEELDKAVKGVFDDGLAAASVKFVALQHAVLEGETVVDLDNTPHIVNLPWTSCKLATTLILIMACSKEPDSMFDALKWQSRSLGGLPNMAEISSTPSADLPKRFSQAKKAAIDGKVGKTTVLGVSLVDVEMIERGESRNLKMNYTSFAHSFVVAIGREGFRVYQSWGEHGYRLDRYLARGGSRRRSWNEAKSFLKSFQKLTCSSGVWTHKLKNAYKECFEVDLDQICGKGRLQAPIVPVYRPWVRLYEINDVTVDNIGKFEWKGSASI